nr:probable xyloglucan galactosyltransferase GT20 [Ipomoea batatas]
MGIAGAVKKKSSRLLIFKKAKPQQQEFISRSSSSGVFLLCFLPSAAILILILVFLTLWSSSTTIISGNLLHVCLSTRKLHNVYCISAGTKPNIHSLQPPAAVNNEKNNALERAYRNVEKLIREQRSWSSSVQISESTSTCRGGVYVYESPAKFNKDLTAQCGDMIPWQNLCKYFNNGALGEPIQKLGRGWYHTHQYSLELIFHSLILNHPCRVYNPNEAKLFYVPFYAGLDILRWHFKNNVSHALKDSLGLELCRFLDCGSGGCDKPGSIVNLFMESEFCMQPPGDSPTRKSVFDSLVAGCIPVLFDPLTAYYQYPWHLPQDHQKYSVLIDQGDVRDMKVNVVERLAEIGVKERENMRRYIVYELLPGLLYRHPNSKLHKFKDAFSITMNNLFERVNRLDG